jgi:hypothetical protein
MASRRDGVGTIDFGLPTLRFWTNTGSLEMWSLPVFSGVPVFSISMTSMVYTSS